MVETKNSQNVYDFLGIVWVNGYPNIHIFSGTGIPVITDGISTYQQVTNIMLFQQSQELFEVGRKRNLHS